LIKINGQEFGIETCFKRSGRAFRGAVFGSGDCPNTPFSLAPLFAMAPDAAQTRAEQMFEIEFLRG